MSFTSIMNNFAGSAKRFFTNHGTEIALGVGSLAVIGSGIGACIASTKIKEKTAEVDHEIESLHNFNDTADPELSEEEDKNLKIALRQRYLKKAGIYAKTYAPYIAGEAVGFGLIIGSHSVLKNRSTALLGAYSSLLTTFTAYQNRVKDKYGEQAETDIRLNAHMVEEEVEKVNKKTGEVTTKTVKKKVYDESIDELNNPWTILWSEGCSRLYDNSVSGYNLMFLRAVERTANDKLVERKWMSINDIRHLLGMEPTVLGAVIGFEHKKNFRISFGLDEENTVSNPRLAAFLDGSEPNVVITLNPNADARYRETAPTNLALC